MVRKKDAVAGAIVIGLAGAALIGLRGLPIRQQGSGVGPGTFPLVVGIGLGLLGSLLLFRSFRYRPIGNVDASSMKRTTNQTRPVAILLVTAGYFGLISLFGFLVSTIVFIFVAVWIFGEKSYTVKILYAVVFGFLAYFVFGVCLNTLP